MDKFEISLPLYVIKEMVNVVVVPLWSLMDALGRVPLPSRSYNVKLKLMKFSCWPIVLVLFRIKTGWWKLERRRKSGDIPQWQLGNCL